MRNTLVLNRSFLAIQIVDWKKSMSLLYQDAALAVDENLQTYDFANWVELSQAMATSGASFVHTTSLKIAVPEVIRLTKYDKLPRTDVKFTRKNLYEHYGFKCCYCSKKLPTSELNLDHVLPKSRGGHTNWTNIVLSCIPCNTRKDNRTPEEAGMRLLVKPSRPRWRGVDMILSQAPVPIPVSWQRLIDAKYWSTELDHDVK